MGRVLPMGVLLMLLFAPAASACETEVARLIDGEARRIGGDLEENAARFMEIDRSEVLPIASCGNLVAALAQQAEQ